MQKRFCNYHEFSQRHLTLRMAAALAKRFPAQGSLAPLSTPRKFPDSYKITPVSE
jgi:hypothetical protein